MQKGKQSNYKHTMRLIILKIDHAIAIGARYGRIVAKNEFDDL
jgi:hypothetical protein